MYQRMQALSREDRVLQELEKIAFGDEPVGPIAQP